MNQFSDDGSFLERFRKQIEEQRSCDVPKPPEYPKLGGAKESASTGGPRDDEEDRGVRRAKLSRPSLSSSISAQLSQRRDASAPKPLPTAAAPVFGADDDDDDCTLEAAGVADDVNKRHMDLLYKRSLHKSRPAANAAKPAPAVVVAPCALSPQPSGSGRCKANGFSREPERPTRDEHSSTARDRHDSRPAAPSRKRFQESPARQRKSRWTDGDAAATAPSWSEPAPRIPPLISDEPAACSSTAASQESAEEELNRLRTLMQGRAKALLAIERVVPLEYRQPATEETEEGYVEGGTWEHKRREMEMRQTERETEARANKTRGKHHLADYLPLGESATISAKLSGTKGDESDFQEHRLAGDNKGFQLLERMGWQEGSGLGANKQGITAPVGKGRAPDDRQGVGAGMRDEMANSGDIYSAYRQRMMKAYTYRPNPFNNPRRRYY